MNYKKAGRLMICLVGGGVTINARSVLNQTAFQVSRDMSLEEKQSSVSKRDQQQPARWWWD